MLSKTNYLQCIFMKTPYTLSAKDRALGAGGGGGGGGGGAAALRISNVFPKERYARHFHEDEPYTSYAKDEASSFKVRVTHEERLPKTTALTYAKEDGASGAGGGGGGAASRMLNTFQNKRFARHFHEDEPYTFERRPCDAKDKASSIKKSKLLMKKGCQRRPSKTQMRRLQ